LDLAHMVCDLFTRISMPRDQFAIALQIHSRWREIWQRRVR
jgi:hypothetical protein